MYVVDLSENNESVDFYKLKQTGIEGVIIRIGWIGNKHNNTIDKKFEEFYNGAKNHNLKIGFYVYSYVKNIESMHDAICWINDRIKNKNYDWPIYLDLEDKTIEECGKYGLTEQSKLFCQSFPSTGIYASLDWFIRLIDIEQIKQYSIWLAEWGVGNPTIDCDIWQYTNKGILSGITGFVDMNRIINLENKKQENGDDEEVKIYKNGSTKESVYSDTNLTHQIGLLNPGEQCECLGIYQNRAIVRYKVDNKENYKIGFVKWLGGVK